MTRYYPYIKSLMIFSVLTFFAALSGSQFMPGDWYAGLIKPTLTPPNIVFPIVWTLLYILMPISMTWVWVRARSSLLRSLARNLFITQLILNALWSWLFFGLHQPLWALFDLVLLWFFVLTMIIIFFRVSKIAALLQVPYLVWITFAGWLNFGIWSLNNAYLS